MKVVAVMGSPHGMDGATGKLLRGLIEGCERAGADVEKFLLKDMKVHPCVACDTCHRTGECSIDDDFKQIKDSFLEADAVVVASPNYIRSVSAQTKAMMDRCCGFIHLQALDDTYGAAVVTSGSGENEVVEEYIQTYMRAVGCWTVGGVGASAWQMQEAGTRQEALSEAESLGKKLVECVRQGTTFPEQEPARSEFHERMKKLVLANAEEWEYERKYWQAKEDDEPTAGA